VRRQVIAEEDALGAGALPKKFELMEELAVGLRYYRLVQRSFWSSERIFRMLVVELRQYAWLSNGWRNTARCSGRTFGLLPQCLSSVLRATPQRGAAGARENRVSAGVLRDAAGGAEGRDGLRM
jgi:hypothetical protein